VKLSKSVIDLVQIGIATKNRWADLEQTLTRLSQFGMSEMRILIYDDSSDTACPFDVKALCPHAEIRRWDGSSGPTLRRNGIARELDSKYFLQLDDDAFPVSGSLESAVEYAESLENGFCLSFPVYNPISDHHQTLSRKESAYGVRSFVGCGTLLHRERFLKLGGYRPELVIYREEEDLSARAYLCDYPTVHFPGLQFHHLASWSGRSAYKMDFYGSRNMMLWNDWYVPNHLKPYRQFRTLTQRILSFVLSPSRKGYFTGVLAGAQDIGKFKSYRSPMNDQLYKQWLSMPPS
jgi:GT2 family glycosyltransferase